MHPDLKQLLKTLKREIYAPTEIPTVLIEFAATHQVDELAAQLPKGVEPQLRQVIAKLHAEDSVYIWEGILMAGVDPKDFFAEKKRLWDDGCRRWREHFGITEADLSPLRDSE